MTQIENDVHFLTENDIEVLPGSTINVNHNGSPSQIEDITVIQLANLGGEIVDRSWYYIGDFKSPTHVWKWESESWKAPSVAEIHSSDSVTVDIAVDHVLESARSCHARGQVHAAMAEIDRDWAIKQAQRAPAQAVHRRSYLQSLANKLLSRAFLLQNEITDITGTEGYLDPADEEEHDSVHLTFGLHDIVRRTGLNLDIINHYNADGRLPLPMAPGRWNAFEIEDWHHERRWKRQPLTSAETSQQAPPQSIGPY